MVQVKITTVEAWICQGCEHVYEEEPDAALYECTEGHTFASSESHRCEQCNKFAAKVADHGCEECDDGEVELQMAYQCPFCNKVYGTIEEATECAVEDAIPADVKKERDAKLQQKLDEDHERYRAKAEAEHLAKDFRWLLSEVEDKLGSFNRPDFETSGTIGVYFPLHMLRELKVLLIAELERREEG